MNFLLDVSNIDIKQPIENLSDKLLYGGQMLLIGMLTVFSVLGILWITLVLFKLIFHDMLGGKTKKEVKAEPTPVYQAPVTNNNEEIIAVIAAAIAMAENECGGGKQFRVVSFKRSAVFS